MEFQESSQVVQHVPTWLKFSYLSELLVRSVVRNMLMMLLNGCVGSVACRYLVSLRRRRAHRLRDRRARKNHPGVVRGHAEPRKRACQNQRGTRAAVNGGCFVRHTARNPMRVFPDHFFILTSFETGPVVNGAVEVEWIRFSHSVAVFHLVARLHFHSSRAENKNIVSKHVGLESRSEFSPSRRPGREHRGYEVE